MCRRTSASHPHSHKKTTTKNKQKKVIVVAKGQIKKGFHLWSCGELKWRLATNNRQIIVRCDVAVAKKEIVNAPGEEFEYQAEVVSLCIVKSLYIHKEVFLRELVSNASDALDTLRFLSVTELSLLGDAGELQICIKPDPENGTITIPYVVSVMSFCCKNAKALFGLLWP
ncbi:heat shock protein 90-5, chloroplastic-like [Argentina anserina]|uniref:heat shock protein 90-5, chloroplastic-like n=1 Tax=Argentina anserina TaxID=57926 RepID=UPI0021767823|nr:heat shock protein 90-5, chloroplastic-like [Potentilla anserina]